MRTFEHGRWWLPLVALALVGCPPVASLRDSAVAPGVDAAADAGLAVDARQSDRATGSDAATGRDAASGRDVATGLDAAPGLDLAPGTDTAPGFDAGSDSGGPLVDAGEPVRADDTAWVLPSHAGRAIITSITGYEMSGPCDGADDPAKCERPLYTPYDRNTDGWWDNLVAELLHSRMHVVMLHGRGCYSATSGDDGNGNMCPRLLRNFVAAVDVAGAREALRVGMFDDTGAYPGTRNSVEGLAEGTPFDLADQTAWRFFWDHNMQVWFDTVPADLWFRLDGRPVVAFWSLADAFFTNQQGNASAMLRWLRQRFIDRYGADPIFDVDVTWIWEDSTITTAEAQGVNDWFGPPANSFTYHSWGGRSWGAVVPSYRDANTFPGCGVACREVLRNDGATLRAGLDGAAVDAFVLLEGFTNVIENAGFYRSPSWRYPNQYLNIIREYSDGDTASMRLEAEAADDFLDTTVGNTGTAFRDSDLDVGALPGGHGWFVGWTEPGEWIEFGELWLSCGDYRFTGRVSDDTPGRTAHFTVDGVSLGSVTLPATGGWDSYQLVHLGGAHVEAGRHALRYVFDSGLSNLDWIFVRKVGVCN